jgi:hypothetical protein
MSYQPKSSSRTEFLRSEKADELRLELIAMTKSPLYNTRVIALGGSGAAVFVEKHMRYMSVHLTMDHSQYIQNLRLMTKISALRK